MRKLMVMACAIMMAIAANAKVVKTVPFTGVQVNVPARVLFLQGDTCAFSVKASDFIVARTIQCSVKDGVLRFKYGMSAQPGEVKYDAKKDIYYYGVNEASLLSEADAEGCEVLITVTSPQLPSIKKSNDYDVVLLEKAVTEVPDDMALNK